MAGAINVTKLVSSFAPQYDRFLWGRFKNANPDHVPYLSFFGYWVILSPKTTSTPWNRGLCEITEYLRAVIRHFGFSQPRCAASSPKRKFSPFGQPWTCLATNRAMH